jgi:hypothetical protein
VPEDGLKNSRKEALKPLKILNKPSRKIGVKRKAWIPFTLNTIIFAKPLARELGISMIGSTSYSRRSGLVSQKKLSSNTT